MLILNGRIDPPRDLRFINKSQSERERYQLNMQSQTYSPSLFKQPAPDEETKHQGLRNGSLTPLVQASSSAMSRSLQVSQQTASGYLARVVGANNHIIHSSTGAFPSLSNISTYKNQSLLQNVSGMNGPQARDQIYSLEITNINSADKKSRDSQETSQTQARRRVVASRAPQLQNATERIDQRMQLRHSKTRNRFREESSYVLTKSRGKNRRNSNMRGRDRDEVVINDENKSTEQTLESHQRQHNFMKQAKKLLQLQKYIMLILGTFPLYIIDKVSRFNNPFGDEFQLEKFKQQLCFIVIIIMLINVVNLTLATSESIQQIRILMMRYSITQNPFWHNYYLKLSHLSSHLFGCRYKSKIIKQHQLEIERIALQISSGSTKLESNLSYLIQRDQTQKTVLKIGDSNRRKSVLRRQEITAIANQGLKNSTFSSNPNRVLSQFGSQEVQRHLLIQNQRKNSAIDKQKRSNLSIQSRSRAKQNSNSSASLQQSPTGNMTPLPYRQTANQLILLNKEDSKEEPYFRLEQLRQQNQPKNSWSQFHTQNASTFLDNDLACNQNRLSQIQFKKRSSIPEANALNPDRNSFATSIFNPYSEVLGMNQISQNEESKTEESEIGRSEQQTDLISRDLIQLSSQQEESKRPHSEDKEETLYVEEIKDNTVQLSSGDNFEERKNQHHFSFANPHVAIYQESQTHTTMKQKNWGAQPNQRKNKWKSQNREQQTPQVTVDQQNLNPAMNEEGQMPSLITIPMHDDQSRTALVQAQQTTNENAIQTQTFVNIMETGISPSHQTEFPTQRAQNLTSEISPAILQASHSLEPFTPLMQERSHSQTQTVVAVNKLHETSLILPDPTIAEKRQEKSNLELTLTQIPSRQVEGVSAKGVSFEKLNSEFDKRLENVSHTLDMIAFITVSFTLSSRSYFKDYQFQQDMETLFERYAGFVYIARNLITSERVRFSTLMLFYCMLQIPWDAPVEPLVRYGHIFMTTVFLYILAFSNNWAKPKKEQKTHEKMDILQKNENNLKQLMQLIPYGIAVVNLDNIANYNKSFARTIGIGRRKNQILEALHKFQRKLKLKDVLKGGEREALRKRDSDKPTSDKMGPLNSSQKQQNNNDKANTTSLFEDLANIQKNRDSYFKDSKHIFDIYYVEREDWFPQASRHKDPRGQKTPKPLLDRNNGQRNSRYEQDKNPESNVSANHQQQGRKIYSISISPITWLDKECFMITVKDITHEKVINQKEVMDKLRNMIFKSFSHELKTPLNGIIMSVDTSKFISRQLMHKIKKERKRGNLQLDEAFQQSKQLKIQINVMESCSYVLKNIMHDFFDYNQLQTNELSLNVKQFDLSSFVKDIKRIVKQQIKFDHVKFKCTVDHQPHVFDRLTSGASPDFVAKQIGNSNPATTGASFRNEQAVKMSADKERLQQVLLNLLMNSIKFTNKGTIELNVFVQAQAVPPCVIFRVKDTGIGIEEERLPYIFNLFEKDENSNLNDYLNLNTKSARMGLPISQNLCQLMGGTIRVRSKLGEGSIFQFRLPLNSEDDFSKTIEMQNQKINSILEKAKQDSQKQLLPKRKRINVPEFSLPLSSQDQMKSLLISGAKGESQGYSGASPKVDLCQQSILTISTNQLPQATNREEVAPARKKAMLVSRPEGSSAFDFSQKVSSLDDNDRDLSKSLNKQALWLQSIKNQNPVNRSLKNIKSHHFHFNNVSATSVIQANALAKYTTPQTNFKNPQQLIGLEESQEKVREDTLQIVQQQVQLSDEDEYCCKIEDDDEEEIEQEEDNSQITEEEEAIDSFEGREEHEEDLEDEVANEEDEESAEAKYFDERSASFMRHREPKKKGGFVFQIQKKVGQFEFVFSSARGRSNSRMHSGRDGFYEEANGGVTPVIRNSSEHLDMFLDMQQQKATAKASQFLQDKPKRVVRDPMAKDSSNFTFTTQLERMEKEKTDLERLQEMRELNQISSRNSVTSNESEKQQRRGQKLEEVGNSKLINRRKTIAVGRVSQGQNTFEEMMRLAYQVDKRPNKKNYSKKFMPSLNSSFQRSLNESRHNTSNSNHMSQKTAQFQSKIHLMKQASKRQIVVKNKLGKEEEQSQTLKELLVKQKINSQNTQAKDDSSQQQDQSLVKSYSSYKHPMSQSKRFKTSSKFQIENSQEIQSLSFLNHSFANNQYTSGLEQNSQLINQPQQTLNNDNNITTGNAYPTQDQHLTVMMGLNSSFKRHSVSYYSRGDSNQTQMIIDNQKLLFPNKLEHFDSMNNPTYQRDRFLIHNLVDPPELRPPSLREEGEEHKTESPHGSNKKGNKSQLSNYVGTPNSNVLRQAQADQGLNVQRQLSQFSGRLQMPLGSDKSRIPYLQVSKNKKYQDIALKINSSIAAIQAQRPLSPNSATVKPHQQAISDSFGTPLMHMASNPHEQLHYSQYDNQRLFPNLKNENVDMMLGLNQSRASSRRPSSRFKQRVMHRDQDSKSNKDLQAPLQSLSDSKKGIFKNLDSKTFNMKTNKRLTGMEKRMNFLGQTGIGSSDRSLIAKKKSQHVGQQLSKFQGSKRPQSINNCMAYSFAHNHNDQIQVESAGKQQPQTHTFFSKAQISQAHLIGTKQDPKPLHSYMRVNQFLASGKVSDKNSLSQNSSKRSRRSKDSKNLSVANNSSDLKSSCKGAHEEFNDSSGYIQDINKGRRPSNYAHIDNRTYHQKNSSPVSPLNYTKILHHRNNQRLHMSKQSKGLSDNLANSLNDLHASQVSDSQQKEEHLAMVNRSKKSEKIANNLDSSPNETNALHKQAIIKNSTKSLIENLSRKQQKINEELEERKQQFRSRVIQEEIKEVNSNKYSLEQSRTKPKSSNKKSKEFKLSLNFESLVMQRQDLYPDHSQSEVDDEGNMQLDSERTSDLQQDLRARDITSNVGRYLFATAQQSPSRGMEELKFDGSLLFVPQPIQQRSVSENTKLFPRSFKRSANNIPSLELQVYDSNGAIMPMMFEKRESQLSNNPFSANQSPIKARMQNRSSLAIDRMELKQVLMDGPLNFVHDQYRIVKPVQESSFTPRDTNFMQSAAREEFKNQQTFNSHLVPNVGGNKQDSSQSVEQRMPRHAQNSSLESWAQQENTSQVNASSKRAQRLRELKKALKLKIRDSNHKLERISAKEQSSDSLILGSKISQSAYVKQENAIRHSLNLKQEEQAATCFKRPTAFTFQPLEIQGMPNKYLGIPYVQNAIQNSSTHNFLSPSKLQNQLRHLRRLSQQPREGNDNMIEAFQQSSEEEDKNDRSKSSVNQNRSSLQNSEVSHLKEESKEAQTRVKSSSQPRESLQDRRFKAYQRQSVKTQQSPMQDQSQQQNDSQILLNKNSSSITQSPFIKLQLQSQSDISNSQMNRFAQDSAVNINGQIQEAPKIRRNNQMGKTKLVLNINQDDISESDSDSDLDSKTEQASRSNKHECPQILVVDDVQMNRYAVEQMLSLIFNLKILQAENGQQAVELLVDYYKNKKCQCKGVKLILMDIEMPIMDGIMATRKIRKIMADSVLREIQSNIEEKAGEERIKAAYLPNDLVIVALTAYMDEKHNCLQAGMSDFMTKPTSKGELEEILRKFQIIS